MNWIIATILSLAIIFAWGGIIYVFFRLRYGKSDDDRERFLETYFRFFTFRIVKQPFVEVTPKVIRDAGRRAWDMILLPIILLGLAMTFWSVVLSVGVLFFGGLHFAVSWYGLRCLRSLNLDSYSTDVPNKTALDNP